MDRETCFFKWGYAIWGIGVNDYIIFSWCSKPVS